MLSKILFSLSLAVTPVVSVSGQSYQSVSAYDYIDFDTFHTEADYLNDFDYLLEGEYEFRIDSIDEIDFTGEQFFYYVFPKYYDIDINYSYGGVVAESFYSNEFYDFYNISSGYAAERQVYMVLNNYVGIQTEFPVLALNSLSMSQVIEYDKVEKSNSISIYNSFYNFFTGFFPDNVVAEYHGIFTFVIVAFLFFLVFGFVFFLFRVIRRLVGFK